MATATKTVNESILFDFDFTRLLNSGETLSSVSSVTETTTSDLTISNTSVSGAKALARISGGVAGKSYCVVATVVTSLGNTRQGKGDLLIINPCQLQ